MYDVSGKKTAVIIPLELWNEKGFKNNTLPITPVGDEYKNEEVYVTYPITDYVVTDYALRITDH